MVSYCLKCKRNTESINKKASRTNNERTMCILNNWTILSKYVIGKNQDLLKKLGTNGLSRIRSSNRSPWRFNNCYSNVTLLDELKQYKMNEITNKFYYQEISLCLKCI